MSTNATSADSSASLSVPTDVVSDAFVAPQPQAARRHAQLRRQLLSADVICGSITGALAALVTGLHWDTLPVVALAIGLGWPVLAYVCGLYASDDLRTWASGVGEAPRLAVTSLLISWPAFGILAALHGPHAVRGALFAGAMTGAGAGLGRAAARVGLHRVPSLRQRTLLLGSGAVAKQLVDRLQRHHELGLDPVGFIDDDVHQPGELGIPRLGTLDSLSDLITFGRVDRVMIAFSRASHEDLLHCIRVCRDKGVTVDIVPRLFEFLDGARSIELVGGIPLLSIQQPALAPLSRFTKRALDVAGASVVLLLLSPLLLAVAVAIKLSSRGGVFFTQQRSGRGGRFFRLYKFRSMKVDATVLVREDGAIVKRPDDDRITRVGRFIRRFSIDEAPQLLNVLKGDMSLVGPRPLVLAEHAALSEDWQTRRADLRPGLTGPWQISGRSHIPFQDMIKFDYQYVAGWSLARDVEILLATLPAVISGRGAY
ncbi:sugar transferase [Candidatus Solirubrobacter pratensis]|uniref:sugar transferase n=1 Tax=Candidatus Solirubrobacter pratensis TaxID=1298857 RepID=UPI000400A6EF|nr:sugar transferase [Candidatus Solirubrobacter pratensis]